MADFRQAPTYKEITIKDVQWVQWFRDLVAFITTQNGLSYTGTGAAVLENTPTLITPDIGVANGTSLVLTGDITTGTGTLHKTTVNLTNGAAAAAGTLLNAPAAGNPTKWIPVDDNGIIRYIPAW